MIIDIFRDDTIKNLSIYNHIVDKIVEGVKFEEHPEFNSNWLNPPEMRLNPLNRSYPDIEKMQYDNKWCLYLSLPDFVSLFVISKLFDNKDIWIEDSCCGNTTLSFYLSRLGFKNFSLFDNFSQMTESYFYKCVNGYGFNYKLNDLSIKPKVVNLTSHPLYPKKVDTQGKSYLYKKVLSDYEEHNFYLPSYIDDETELFTLYMENADKLRNQLFDKDFVFLATDSHKISFIYCKRNKQKEFQEKLKNYDTTI